MLNRIHIQDEKGRLAGSISLGGKEAPTAPETPLTGLPIEDKTDPIDLDAMHARLREITTVDQSTPHLYEVFPQATYEEALAAGHIRVQTHPEAPYLIHNYTEACTWENGWNEATLACRGLITHAETGEVIARPYPKFFNHDQPGAPVIDIDDEVVVMDKADGSLAVHYRMPDGEYRISTRGSFASDQATWASEFYARTYAGRWEPNPHLTYLYEIVYPENRVVLDYGDTEDLILLGAVETTTGRSVHVHEAAKGWPGPTVEVFPHTTFREALAAPNRDNAEGFVIWHPETDTRVKIKQEDYKIMHRFMTATTPKHVWEVLASGQDPNAVFAAAPDEFHGWLKEQVGSMRNSHAEKTKAAQAAYSEAIRGLPEGYGRKEFAIAVAKHPDKSLLFALLDGKSIEGNIWRSLKPSGSQTVRIVSGDSD